MDIYEGNTLLGSVKQYSGAPQQAVISYNTSEKVTDDVRGYLVFNGVWRFFKKNQYTPTKDYKKLALILESPHMDEYRINNVVQRTSNGLLDPQRPANGFAGDQIDKFIQNRPWKNQLSTSDVYEVLVMNAIQYQCSAVDYIQGLSNAVRRLTDAIFLVMWDYNTTEKYPFQDDLVNRIQMYSPDIIINACTKGKRKPSLQMRVQTLVINMARLYDIDDHPANPRRFRWR